MTYSAADRVYADVKELILTGGLAGGELISEGEIAERCAVSRTPVREAFLRLSAEGWMRLYPKRGALIVPIGDREARDVLDARVAIESHAARSVVGRPAELAQLSERLRDNLAQHADVSRSDTAEFARLDAEFHQLIVAAGGNAILSEVYVSLRERHRRMTASRLQAGAAVADTILDDHARLAEAITDPEAFTELLITHLSTVHDLPGGLR
ncbi:DNA-binding transcriptional regulator, GntR family [Gordonia malaquae]|uniref:Putative GntR family transcriptional regulator n=1 Tax=Gordonia malaquae NBRC 108250 TaxID=1223542 RepID=M3VCD1_GORML|nr:GntR family transcriptional regulator [Gordonia malaquae]GAC81803.1 putative GntR family transcriptional regulator [Gordonia malaquae NBRC 108250]SEB70607.1 DNA-binding transcriptional regulator, GntR family [Gordonia malaquae]